MHETVVVYIINISTHFFQVMDVGTVESLSSHVKVGQILHLTCISAEGTAYRIASCPCFTVRVREAHVSFVERPGDRYLVLICETQVIKVEDLPSPCTIRVNSAADFGVNIFLQSNVRHVF